MSILSEPRKKTRYSIDPQNLNWKNDDQKFSKKLMSKMGWNDGDGLGKNRQGDAENVKLKANYTGKGLGADKLQSYDTTWIGHHDDFADLLNALNKNKEIIKSDNATEKDLEKMSMELKSKSVRRRIHYQKFTRAKDTSNYTDNDKSSIMGLGLKRNKSEADLEVKKETDESKEPEAGNTVVSTLSVADYFAAKMAALKNKSPTKVKSEIKEEVHEEDGYGGETGEVKQEVDDYVKKEVKQEVEEEETEEQKAERRRLKKERKLAKRRAREEEEGSADVVDQVEEEKKEDKKDGKPDIDDDAHKSETEEEKAERRRLKKERKLAKRQLKMQNGEESSVEKHKRTHEQMDEDAQEGEEPKKKRRIA